MMIDLDAIFGDGLATALSATVLPEPAPTPEAGTTDNDAELLAQFAGWVRRPDVHGRMGWEAPNLPEWQRWWARCDFAELPTLPEGRGLDDMATPTRQDCACCVPHGKVDTLLDLSQHRPAQGHLRGFGGA